VPPILYPRNTLSVKKDGSRITYNESPRYLIVTVHHQPLVWLCSQPVSITHS